MKITEGVTGAVLYEDNASSVRETVENALTAGIDLTGANLYGANLTRANLADACLALANLVLANLTGANLVLASLVGSNLTGADLTRACLCGSNLTGADLTGACLYGADLTDVNLARACLADACLTLTCLCPLSAWEWAQAHAVHITAIGGRTLILARRSRWSLCVGAQDYSEPTVYHSAVFSTDVTSCHPGLYLVGKEGDVLCAAWLDEAVAVSEGLRVRRFRRLHSDGLSSIAEVASWGPDALDAPGVLVLGWTGAPHA